MARQLLNRVAKKVLTESLRIRPGENVAVESWNTGLDFARTAVLEARRIGATPVLLLEDEDTFVASLRESPTKFAGTMGRHEVALLSRTNGYVFIPGPLLGGSPRLSRAALSRSTAYNPSWYEAAKKARLRGARMLFGYVGPDLAGILRRPLGQVVEHQLTAALTDFRRVHRTGLALSGRLRAGARLTLTSDGETLSFGLGREEALDDGTVSAGDVTRGENITNIPPGYYAREIAPSTLEGTVCLFAPVPRIGAVADLRLQFKEGRLTRWESDSAQREVNRLVEDTPRDRRTLSALVIGLNPALRRGFGQDRLVEGAVSFFGLLQSTTRGPTLKVGSRTLIRDGAVDPALMQP